MNTLAVCGLIASISACAISEPSDDDQPDPIVDGKGDGYVFGIDVHSYEADAIVELANSASVETLVSDVGLAEPSAIAIVRQRTFKPFATLLEISSLQILRDTTSILSAGRVAFSKMSLWVRNHHLVGSCGDGVVQPSIESCEGTADCDACHITGGAPIAAVVNPDTFGRVVQNVPLANGSFAVASVSYDEIQVTALEADGSQLWSRSFKTSIAHELVPTLLPTSDGRLTLTFNARAVRTPDRLYSCDFNEFNEGCGFVFVLDSQGRVIGRAVERHPKVLLLPTGKFMVSTLGALALHVALLDGTTLQPMWNRHWGFDGGRPVGPFIEDGQFCVLTPFNPQPGASRWMKFCHHVGTGDIESPVEVWVGDDKLTSTPTGVFATSPTGIRAITSGVSVPASIPWSVLPALNAVPLGDGRLVVLSPGWISMISAAGAIEWQYPAPRSAATGNVLAVGHEVILAQTKQSLFPGLPPSAEQATNGVSLILELQ